MRVELKVKVAYRGGQMQVIGPNDGSQKWFQSCGIAAEKRLVVTLVLTVLLRRLWRKYRVRVIPANRSALELGPISA